ncbi:MAG: hypothetical protein R3F35_08240 [Myxococcota bacterium]
MLWDGALGTWFTTRSEDIGKRFAVRQTISRASLDEDGSGLEGERRTQPPVSRSR